MVTLYYTKLTPLPDRAAMREAEHLVGRRLICRVLRCTPEALRIKENGKPYLPGGPCFSLSHSGGLVLLAVSDEGEVGCDTEPADREIRNPEAIRRKISRPGDSPDAPLLKLWVRAEAQYKSGLGEDAAVCFPEIPGFVTAICGGAVEAVKEVPMEGYHRTWAEVSLDAIAANVSAVKGRLAPGTRLMCVIKADGYGHGAVALGRFLADKCDFFGVATLEEALTLRTAGVTKPLLILGYTSPSQYDAVVAAGLSQTIFSAEQASALSRAAVQAGRQAAAHLAVDTGMGRIGFGDTAQAAAEIAELAQLPGLVIEGLFTHFARADEADQGSALGQYQRFSAFSARLEAAGVRIPLKHACNSAAAMAFDTHFDMIRLGIAMYGLYPSEVLRKSLTLRPAMSWKTHVVHLKTVPAGTGISYGHDFVTARETRVATLSIGYGDGYPRALSNRGRVIIRGRFAPILGRVCMDQMMVDVTDIHEAALEDEVILVGEEAGLRVSMEEIGEMSASFNYETACRVGQRVTRVYQFHGNVVDIHSSLVTAEEFTI